MKDGHGKTPLTECHSLNTMWSYEDGNDPASEHEPVWLALTLSVTLG
jgi:hypothetical protein